MPGILNRGGGSSVQREPTVWSLEASPTGGGADMAEVRLGCCRSLRLAGKHTLPTVFLPVRPRHPTGHGCSGPSMARHTAVCSSASQPYLPNLRVRDQGLSLILIAPLWPSKHWIAEIIQLLVDEPWPLPTCQDLLSGEGDISSSPRPGGSLGLACERLNLNAAGLPLKVTDTIQKARASFTCSLYSGK